MVDDSKHVPYITVFSRKIYKYLLKKNISPFCIEPNKKYPEFMVYKYNHSDYVLEVISQVREGKPVL